MIIPVLMLIIIGFIIISRTRLGEALAHRIAGGTPSELAAQIEAMEAELASLRGQLAETQERLDFAERILAQAESGARALER